MEFQSQKQKNQISGPVSARQVQELLSNEDWRAAGEVLQTLRPSLDVETFVSARDRLTADGYRLIGLRIGEVMASIASFTISPHAMLGRELLIHDMATRKEMEKKGHASQIIAKLESIARGEGCGRVFVHTVHAQGLYSRNGFKEYSTGMIKIIDR